VERIAVVVKFDYRREISLNLEFWF